MHRIRTVLPPPKRTIQKHKPLNPTVQKQTPDHPKSKIQKHRYPNQNRKTLPLKPQTPQIYPKMSKSKRPKEVVIPAKRKIRIQTTAEFRILLTLTIRTRRSPQQIQTAKKKKQKPIQVTWNSLHKWKIPQLLQRSFPLRMIPLRTKIVCLDTVFWTTA